MSSAVPTFDALLLRSYVFGKSSREYDALTRASLFAQLLNNVIPIFILKFWIFKLHVVMQIL